MEYLAYLRCLYCIIPFIFGLMIFFVFIPQRYWPYLWSWFLLTIRDAIWDDVEPGVYPVLSAHRFFKVVTEHRMLYVRGPLGSGKSTLAAWVCMFLLTFEDEYGRSFVKRVAANIPHRWPRPTLSQGCDMSVIWFDELGLFLDSRSWGKSDSRYWAGLRKLRSVIIGSSRIPVDKRLAELWCQRTTELPFSYIKNSWFYLWGYESGDELDGGLFFIYKPQAVWPYYPTSAYPTSDGGVLDLLDISIKRAERLGVQDYRAFDFDDKPLPDGVGKETKAAYQSWISKGKPSYDYFSTQFQSVKGRWDVMGETGDLDDVEGAVLLEELGQLHDLALDDGEIQKASQIKAWYDEQIQHFTSEDEAYDNSDNRGDLTTEQPDTRETGGELKE